MPKRGRVDRTLYCHCKQPLRVDEQTTMVACEICDNWFHLRCVGLREDDELPKNFMCSDCVAEGFIGSASEDWIMEAAEHGPAEKVLPKRQRRIGKPAAQRKSSDKTLPKGDAVVRGKVRDKLTEALSGSEGAANSKAAEEAAGRVEEALLRCYEGTGPDYKKKSARSRLQFCRFSQLFLAGERGARCNSSGGGGPNVQHRVGQRTDQNPCCSD